MCCIRRRTERRCMSAEIESLFTPQAILVVTAIVIFTMVLFRRPSRKDSYGAINSYSSMLDEYNADVELLTQICQKIAREHDPGNTCMTRINAFIDKANEASVQFKGLSDRMEYCLKKKNLPHYRQYESCAAIALAVMKDSYDSLLEIEKELSDRTGRETEQQNDTWQEEWSEIYRSIPDEMNSGDVFFSGCGTRSEYEKRYHELAKVYHPDSGHGDADTFRKITDRYNEIISGM